MTPATDARWLLRALIGPGLWAAGFAAVYGLHGMGCALGWNLQQIGPVSVHRAAMVAVWGATLAGCLLALRWLPPGPGLPRRMPRIGAWIGLGATIFTLLPLPVATTC